MIINIDNIMQVLTVSYLIVSSILHGMPDMES